MTSENTDGFLYFKCPHCFDDIIVKTSELNCRIFRHGVFKHNMEQINPHESKENCDNFLKNNKIYGCGKPFKIIGPTGLYYNIEICDYI